MPFLTHKLKPISINLNDLGGVLLIESFKEEWRDLLQFLEQWREEPLEILREKIKTSLHNIRTTLDQTLNLPSCSLIRDMEHRVFMRKGLRDAKRQFHIATDRINQNTLSAGLHLWISGALDRNAQVSIIGEIT